jgi:hypothetical protein
VGLWRPVHSRGLLGYRKDDYRCECLYVARLIRFLIRRENVKAIAPPAIGVGPGTFTASETELHVIVNG